MKNKSAIYLVFSFFFLVSCNTYKYQSRVSNIRTDNTHMVPNVVDVEINFNKKISANSGRHLSPTSAKEEAYFNAVTQNEIDVLVSPIYEIETTSRFLFFGGRSTARVTGFAGKFVNSRTLYEEQDRMFDQKLAAIDRMLENETIKNEEIKTYLVTYGLGNNSGEAGTHEITTNQSTIEKFNSLYYLNLPQNNAASSNTNNEDLDEDFMNEERKNKLKRVAIGAGVVGLLAIIVNLII